MIRYFTIFIFTAMLLAVNAVAEEFVWSWEKESSLSNQGGVTQAPSNQAADSGNSAPAKGDETAGGSFTWSWKEDGERADGGKPEKDEQAKKDSAYAELLKDNLKLRRKISETIQEERAIREENERLSRQIRNLEQKITQSVLTIQGLRKEQSTSSLNLDAVLELESQLIEAEDRKAKLNKEMEALIRQAKFATPSPKRVDPVSPSPRTGSNLFKQIERENIILKEK
ncbi:hypothetical protein ACFLS1_12890, partial [Verrucomicrobiota bacterium]